MNRQNIIIATEQYNNCWSELYQNKSFYMSEKDFLALTRPWHSAVKSAGLQFRKGCVYTGNNRNRLPFILLPKRISFFLSDLSDDYLFFKDLIIASVKYDAQVKAYYLSREVLLPYPAWELMLKENRLRQLFLELDWSEAPDSGRRNCLAEKQLVCMEGAYKNLLSKKVAIAYREYRYSGWQEGTEGLSYWMHDDTVLETDSEAPIRFFDSGRLYESKIFRIFFSLVIFSITKPLLSLARLPVGFFVNAHFAGKGCFDERLNNIREWICYIANPNLVENIYKNAEFMPKNTRHLAAALHHNFPLLFYKEDKQNGRLLEFTKRDTERLKKASCLPIILSDHQNGTRYFDPNCLSIFIALPQTYPNYYALDENRRDDLFIFLF